MRGEGTKLGEGDTYRLGEGETILSSVRATHNKLGDGERKVRLGQDSLPNIAETSRKLAESSDVVLPAPQPVADYHYGATAIGHVRQ